MKNLLFLAHRIPYPPNKGDKIRSYHFLKHLAADYNVHLGTFIDDDNDWQYREKVNELCASTCYQALKPFTAKIASARGLLTGEALSLPYYRNRVMQAWVDSTIQKHAINKVLIFSSVMGQFIKPTHHVEMVADFVDVDSDKWRQYAEKKRGLAKWIYQREAQYLFNYEQALAMDAKVSTFVSEQEAELFKTLAPDLADKISYINQGVDTDYFSPEHAFTSPYPNEQTGKTLVFVGAMDYWANVDAVVWFAQQVLPLIVQQHPNAKFYIVGARPTKDVQALASDTVIVTGAVPDVRPYVAYAQLAVAPLRIARGIQNKVLEAMSMEKYVIASSAAMEGIAYDAELALTIADTETTMAEEINQLLNSKVLRDCSMNRQFVKNQFSWKNNLKQLVALIG